MMPVMVVLYYWAVVFGGRIWHPGRIGNSISGFTIGGCNLADLTYMLSDINVGLKTWMSPRTTLINGSEKFGVTLRLSGSSSVDYVTWASGPLLHTACPSSLRGTWKASCPFALITPWLKQWQMNKFQLWCKSLKHHKMCIVAVQRRNWLEIFF